MKLKPKLNLLCKYFSLDSGNEKLYGQGVSRIMFNHVFREVPPTMKMGKNTFVSQNDRLLFSVHHTH